MSGSVYLVHGLGLTAAPMELAVREARDTLVDPPAALRYRCFRHDDRSFVVASALGGLLVVQDVGTAVTRQEALSFYDDATVFDPWYVQAVTLTAGFIGQDIKDLSFSFVWHAVDGPPEVDWQYVRLAPAARPLLLKATLVWCLAEVVDTPSGDFPSCAPRARSTGPTSPRLLTSSPSASLGRCGPARRRSRRLDGSTMRGSWATTSRRRTRFDQAASGFSFFWEAAERHRETTLTLALAVLAVVGVLQADQQLHRLTELTVNVVE